MSKFAWVTLATNDSYSLGALVVAYSLKRVNTVHQLAVLITPGVSESMRTKLKTVFNVVEEVNVLDSQDSANLGLLSRPELGVTFTKLHCWRLTQFDKCVFLDADTLILQNCDELFGKEEFSAAPDVGWPDCFNSGVFVFKPNLDTFGKLIDFAIKKGSFDGGDQGLLNQFFSDWAHKDISKHLPFIYNTCSTACYSYLPAFKQFGKDVKILHFIGQLKPWLVNFDSATKQIFTPQGYEHLKEYLQMWWNIFCNQIHPQLSGDMGGIAGALAKLTLGVPRSVEQEAYEESMRRQSWESGHIDYLGKDSFDNIWKRITLTLANKAETTSTVGSASEGVGTTGTTASKNVITKRELTPTPQPEDLTIVDTKKEVKVGPPIIDEIDEDYSLLKGTHTTITDVNKGVRQQVITEVTAEGKIIQKTIVTYEGEETEETEVYELTEIGDQKIEKRTTTGTETKALSTKAEMKPTQQTATTGSVIIIPGTAKTEFDSLTNTKTVTEKTTTGSIQTITTFNADGTTKIQTKTFFDPVEIPGEEEEEEEIYEEETETYEPGAKKTTTTTTTTSNPQIRCSELSQQQQTEQSTQKITSTSTQQQIAKTEQQIIKSEQQINTLQQEINTKQQIDKSKGSVQTNVEKTPQPTDDTVILIPGTEIIEFNEKTNTRTVTQKTTTGSIITITTINDDGTMRVQTKTFYDPVEVPLNDEEQRQLLEKIKQTDVVKTQEKSTTSTSSILATTTQNKQLSDETVILIPGTEIIEFNEKTNTRTVTQKTTTGSIITITTTNDDGTTRVQTKIFYDPVEVPLNEEEKRELMEQIKQKNVEKKQQSTTTTTLANTTQDQHLTDDTVVLIPGTEVIEIDDKTNTRTVTQKTTTGSIITITTTNADGTTHVQTKTFYDPVQIPGEEIVKEETYEETVEPGKTTSTTTTTTTTTSGETTQTEQQNVSKQQLQQTEIFQQIDKTKQEINTSQQKINTTQNQSNTIEKQIDTVKQNPNVIVIPGTETVEYDEITKTTIVTQKTTTGYIKTITTITEDGQTKVETKTFFDPVVIPSGEDEVIEEETYEETETINPGSKKTITTVTKRPDGIEISQIENSKQTKETEKTQEIIDNTQQTVANSKKKVEKSQQQMVNVQEKIDQQTGTTTKQQIASAQQKVEKSEQHTMKSQRHNETTNQQQQITKRVECTQQFEVTQKFEQTQQVENSQKQIQQHQKQLQNTDTTMALVSTEPKTKVVKRTASDGTDVEVVTTVSSDGKTKSQKKTITTPEEEIEIEETEEIHTYEPGEVKVRTTTKIIPVDSSANVKQVTDKSSNKQTTASKTRTETVQIEELTESNTVGKDSKTIKTDGNKKIDIKKKGSTNATTISDTTTFNSTDRTDTAATTKQTSNKSSTANIKKECAENIKDIISTKITKDGDDVTTEVIRRIPGGTEHTYTTIRADGTQKFSSKTFYDAVPVEGSEEEEEVEEIETTTTKTTSKPTTKIITTSPKVKIPEKKEGKPIKKATPKSPTVTAATPPTSPPFTLPKSSGDLEIEHEILETPPIGSAKDATSKNKKLPSTVPNSKTAAVATGTTGTSNSTADVNSPVPPPRKKEVKKIPVKK